MELKPTKSHHFEISYLFFDLIEPLLQLAVICCQGSMFKVNVVLRVFLCLGKLQHFVFKVYFQKDFTFWKFWLYSKP